MDMSTEIVLEIDPRGVPRPLRGRWSSYYPEWYYEYKDKLKELIGDYIISDVLENVVFVMPMAKSWSKKKKREYDGQPHKQKPDLDNLVKGLMDAALEEDCYVHEFKNIKKVWGYTGQIKISPG